MTTRSLLGLVRLNLRRGRRSFVFSAFGVAIGIASLTFFLALSSGVQAVVLGRIFPTGQLEIVPRKSSLGGPLDALSAFAAGPKPIDDAFVAALEQRPEVDHAYRRMKLSFPARAWGGQQLLGREVHAELIAEGLDPAATKGDDLAPQPFVDPAPATRACNENSECGAGEYCPWDTHRCELPVPAVISPFLIEIYNGTIAKAHGLPQMGQLLASRLRGITFTVELGRSFLGQGLGALGGGAVKALHAEPHQRTFVLVGVSKAASPLALSVPIGYTRAWNREYAGEQAAHELSSVVAVLKPGAKNTALASFVRDRGYDIADSGAEQAGLAITLVTALLSLVSLAILLVAAMNIAHGFFRAVAERRRELGLLRALGATQRDLSSMLLTEAAALGVVGGTSGVVIARLLALGVDLAARTLVPDFPFKPDTFFAFHADVVAIGLVASIAACVLGALMPARLAARVDPAAALSGS